MLDLAADVVSALGRWPELLPPGFCPQERRLEVRLALVLNAYMAKPYEEFFDAVRHKKQLRALRRQTSSVAQPAPDVAAAARWRGKLRELGLDVSPVAAEHVFRHRPSKTISTQPEQKQVLEKFGVYIKP